MRLALSILGSLLPFELFLILDLGKCSTTCEIIDLFGPTCLILTDLDRRIHMTQGLIRLQTRTIHVYGQGYSNHENPSFDLFRMSQSSNRNYNPLHRSSHYTFSSGPLIGICSSGYRTPSRFHILCEVCIVIQKFQSCQHNQALVQTCEQ